uniref:Large ribosomal subunit protein bL35c n=1 Tax=Sonderella linearis TaxID=110477 RepID=A0A1Z1MMR4_9FLOR|nr:ribosomal protein L35 [Sonderella linearis]ARW67051.1 ribosomal protein L35 [Sonderella linearis]
MYKLKTIKSVSKRFKITSNKKILRHKACKNHLLQKKTSKRKRHLCIVSTLHFCDNYNLKNCIPYLY